MTWDESEVGRRTIAWVVARRAHHAAKEHRNQVCTEHDVDVRYDHPRTWPEEVRLAVSSVDDARSEEKRARARMMYAVARLCPVYEARELVDAVAHTAVLV